MNLTHNNPFRILGLPLTAGARDITKQVNTLATYAEMGKTKSFETDFSFLPPVNRTAEVIEEAHKRIEQSENRFLYSLFWFWTNNSVDELAWDVLKEGRVERAIEIWEKAIFANNEKTYKPVALYDNLITQSSEWGYQWPEADDEDHSVRKNDEAYVIERKAATSYSIPSVHAFSRNDEKDWSIECDTDWIEGVDNLGYGIVFGKDKGNYFTFELAASGYYRFDKYVDWNFTSLIPWKSSAVVDLWGTNHLKITSTNNQISFHINGQFVDSVQREPFFGDYLGFKVTNAQTIVFRNFKICRLIEDDAYGAGIKVSSKNFSNIKNLSVLFLSLTANGGTLEQDYLRKGAALANKCFSDEHIEEYSKLVAGERYVYDPDKALQFYLSNVVDSLKQYLDKPAGISTGELIQTFSAYPIAAKHYINTRFLAKPIQNIEKEIASAQAARNSSPSAAVDVGKSLVEVTKSDIEFLKAAIGKSDYQYQSIADKLASEVVQCGIDYFNATRNDEPGLPLYQYGSLVAVSHRTQEKTKENLDSCEEWIKNKIYYFCWFCGKNQPNSKDGCSRTIYRETDRFWFPKSVRFSSVSIPIPRCSQCRQIQNRTPDKYWALLISWASGLLVIGAIIGAIVDIIPDLGAGGGTGTVTGSVGGALVGAFIGWKAGENLKCFELSKAGVKDTSDSTISQYPMISQRLNEGWQMSEPTA